MTQTTKHKMRLALTMLALTAGLTLQAANIPGIPSKKGKACTFHEGVRYSELVINSRINDFRANTKTAGFGVFGNEGQIITPPLSTMSKLDYVPGLVAKAILEAVDYYKDNSEVNVKPWYYAMQYYGCRYDIAPAGKQGKSFDDLNAVKLYFMLKRLAASGCFADGKEYSNQDVMTVTDRRMADALQGIKLADRTYVIKATTLADAAGGWWHKSGYVNQMWCDGQYMGPALLAQMMNEYGGYSSVSDNDWDLIVRQFSISWAYLWNDNTRLLYHAFTADPASEAAKDWVGISDKKGSEVYHSAEYWGRAMGWYLLALVDIMEQMQQAELTQTANYQKLHSMLTRLAAGIAAKQDATSGCWYQLTNHDGNYTAQTYNSSYRYADHAVKNYLESSATAIFTAAFLKGARLGMLDKQYIGIARRAYRGMVERFMVSDGKGGVHLIGCCKSAGLGGSNYRDGSAEYYLLGQDTEPTVSDPASPSFYTEGKVFGAFILAATEYERL